MEIGALALSFVIAVATAYLAKQRERSVVFWFLLALLFGVLATLLLLILPKASEMEEERARKDLEEEEGSDWQGMKWFYLDSDRKEKGNVTFQTLKELWEAKEVDLETYVWIEGMKEWKRISEIPKLKQKLSTS